MQILNSSPDRSLTVDITKGLLIILVVIGHSGIDQRYIFWFHMPAFFIVSGFFLKQDASVSKVFKAKFQRLVMPYLSFSLILGLLARNTTPPIARIMKMLIATLWGGCLNTTTFTYPYYFINVLFFTTLIYYIGQSYINRHRHLQQHQWVSMTVYCLLLYLMISLINKLLSNNWFALVPWALDDACYVTIFLLVGKLLYPWLNRINSGKSFSAIGICILLLILDSSGLFHYEYNLKSHLWFVGIDIIIPIIFTTAIFALSKWLNKIPYVNKIFAFIGQASLTIFFMHTLFLHVFPGHILANTLLSISISCLCYLIFVNSKYLRTLFLGIK